MSWALPAGWAGAARPNLCPRGAQDRRRVGLEKRGGAPPQRPPFKDRRRWRSAATGCRPRGPSRPPRSGRLPPCAAQWTAAPTPPASSGCSTAPRRRCLPHWPTETCSCGGRLRWTTGSASGSSLPPRSCGESSRCPASCPASRPPKHPSVAGAWVSPCRACPRQPPCGGPPTLPLPREALLPTPTSPNPYPSAACRSLASTLR